MVQAWYMDNEQTDQRCEHHLNPPQYVDLDELFRKTGVEYFKLNVETHEHDGVLAEIKSKRGYTYEDEVICSKECMPNYEEKLKAFYQEHLHADEEIRFVLKGSGYLDVRDADDKWIRIAFETGDMIILPSGIYHRFTLDLNNYIKVKRLFLGEPVWLAHNRPADDQPSRVNYLERLQNGFQEITA